MSVGKTTLRMNKDDHVIDRPGMARPPFAEPSDGYVDVPPLSGNGAAAHRRRPKPRRGRRRLAFVLIVSGALLASYAALVVLWRDPVTDLYNRWQQHRLDGALAATFEEFQESEANLASQRAGAARAVDEAAAQQQLIAAARRFNRSVELGQPLGRIVVPRLGLNKVFVHGTRWAEDLSRGPGHYPETGIPAVGKTVAIAGHRTTFGAPFRYINRLREGDEIRLQLAYGTFTYRVVRHKIVDNSDWSIIKPRGYDAIVLSACHPLYSAAQRWVVFGRLSTVRTMNGRLLTLWRPGADAAAAAA
jgi:sortase A